MKDAKTASSRREFIQQAAAWSVVQGGPGRKEPPAYAPDHQLTVISGRPRSRGLQYGRIFKDRIHAFLDKEIYGTFAKNPPSKDDLLRYAGGCAEQIRRYSPVIIEEMEGMTEGSGLPIEETVLVTLHEELWHRGLLPAPEHCTAVAAGPPDTRDGNTYIAQSWDWMQSVYGMSSLLLWKRPEGPSVLSYSFPGLWVGAGMNSRGVALVWTSTQNPMKAPGPLVGIPTYVLLAQMLYQDSLRDAVEEARRAKHAGWFTIVMGDGRGRLVNVEAAPGELEVELSRGSLARTYHGTRKMTRTPEGQPVKFHPQVQRMLGLLAGKKGQLDRLALQGFYGDHQSTICKHYSTLDVVLFNATQREAWLERGPGCSGRWKRFAFDAAS